MYERPRVKVERGWSFTFTRNLWYIALILYTYLKFKRNIVSLMRRKRQGNTFLDISSRISSIQTCQTPWGFLLPSVWIGATLRSKSEIFVFEFFFFFKSNQTVTLLPGKFLSQNKYIPKRKFVIVLIKVIKIRVKGCSTLKIKNTCLSPNVNSVLQAKVWFSPSWSHLNTIQAKKAQSKGYSTPR